MNSGFAEEPQSTFSGPMGKLEFLSWVRTQDGRYEYENGYAVMQARITRGHSVVANEFLVALNARINRKKWHIHVESFGVEAGPNIRYPDVMVEERGGDLSDMTTAAPVLLVEVLSPSSIQMDLTEKVKDYLSINSLQVYIVASQSQPLCWVWQRDAVSGHFDNQPVEFSGKDRSLPLAYFEIELPLAEIYEDVSS